MKIFLFIFCCCYTICLKAQETGIKYLHFTRHNFLATNQVNCIIQDKKKFMWFATSNGLQRFDGNRWIWLTQEKNSASSLQNNDVEWLLEDGHQRFWVQTASGISLLNRDNLEFANINITSSSEGKVDIFQNMVGLQDGRTWFASTKGALYYYDELSNQFISASKIIPQAGYIFYQVAYDSIHHQYFLGTDKGMVIYNVLTKEFYHFGFNPRATALLNNNTSRNPIITIYLNNIGQLWFSGETVHTCYDIKKDSIVFCDSSSKISGVLGYTTDHSGITWGYGANIIKMNLTTGRTEPIEQTPDKLYGISFQNGSCLMEDSENTYWIATTNGVFIYNRFQQQFVQHAIKSYATGEVINNMNVWGFIESADSSIIALTSRAEGLYYFDKNLIQLPSKFNLSSYANARSFVNIRCGLRDNNDHLWVAIEQGTLLKLYPENGKVEAIRDTVFAGLGIYSMAQDKQGNLWFGTFKHVIIRKDAITGKFKKITELPKHMRGIDNVFKLFYDGNKYIWAATSKSGLLKLNTLTNTVDKIYANKPGDSSTIPSSRIFSIAESSFNELIMSTPLGIVVMDVVNEKFHLLNTEDGLPDNNVTAILKGGKRNLWVSSDNGISKIKQDGMKITSYGVLEGLTNEIFNINACIQLNDGRMLFGRNEGFTSFNPTAFSNDPSPDNVTITGIRLFDEYLNIDSILNKNKALVLTYYQNFLTIEFSNMSFARRYQTQYYYQLQGVDKNWIRCNGMPQATYTSLPGGKYTFMVKCKTKSGIDCEKITSFKINIIPPIWNRWWFYMLGVITISGTAFLFFYARYRRIIETEKVRNRIAKDLHDDMGSTLSTINILSEMAKKKIDTDIPVTKKFIHQISDNSNRLMETMDDIVWNIDTANNSVDTILCRMREFAGSILEARDISYTFKEDKQIKNIHLELGRRHDFFMIFKEAINNLAKYSECTLVTIEISILKNMLRLFITDNGKGFWQDLPIEGNGLLNMRQRAASLNGMINIKSEINKGTSVELIIPL